eukprot:NODE_136_length_2647_cov_44.434565_g109_i0.p1 GENE.NODE_136_length_2647_cov_44.434565_g109_i0~~NODE_136_length_2647_cov_44.434565_g109_i0.p1  ORF type:complete len:864 (+),score=383.61 NODE_136_length_2647_cov_44.434565_g109_i0:32-2593(+)
MAKGDSAAEHSAKVKVCVRVRPFFQKALELGPCVVPVSSKGPDAILAVLDKPGEAPKPEKSGKAFDELFWSVGTDQAKKPKGVKKIATNLDLFETVGKPALQKAFQGFNSTIFAYGQTGSGKTYTMMGAHKQDQGSAEVTDDPNAGGLIPLIVEEMFKWISDGGAPGQDKSSGLKAEWEVKFSFMEVYNDSRENGGTIKDLCPWAQLDEKAVKTLREEAQKALEEQRGSRNPGITMDALESAIRKALPNAGPEEVECKVRQLMNYKDVEKITLMKFTEALDSMKTQQCGRGRELGILAENQNELGWMKPDYWYPKGLAEHKVDSWNQIKKLLEDGTGKRLTKETQSNKHSSRSHAIVQIRLDSYLVGEGGDGELREKVKTATINLVDLAGSERYDKAGTLKTGRYQETASINYSLHCLGRVIDKLGKKLPKDKVMGEIRQATLTRLLSVSLGGNCETWMVACISPDWADIEETVGTLTYATTTRKIENVVRVNAPKESKIQNYLSDIRAALENATELQAHSERVKQLQMELEKAKEFESRLSRQRQEDHAELERERKLREELELKQEQQRKEYERQLGEARKDLTGVSTELDHTKDELLAAQDLRKILEEQLKEKEKAVEDMQAQSDQELQQRLAAINETVKDAHERRAQAEKANADHRAKLEAAQKDLSRHQTELMLKDKEMGLLQAQIKAMDEGDQELQKKYQEQTEKLRAVQHEADDHLRLARERELEIAAKETRIQELESKLRDRLEELGVVGEELNDKRTELMHKERRLQEMEDAMRRRETELQDLENTLRTKFMELREAEEELRCKSEEVQQLLCELKDKEEELQEIETGIKQLAAIASTTTKKKGP